MSFAQRATATPPQIPGPGMPCPIAELLRTLPKDEAKGLKAIIDSPWRVWTHKAVEELIATEGYTVGEGSVGRHRRLTCRCRKTRASA